MTRPYLVCLLSVDVVLCEAVNWYVCIRCHMCGNVRACVRARSISPTCLCATLCVRGALCVRALQIVASCLPANPCLTGPYCARVRAGVRALQIVTSYNGPPAGPTSGAAALVDITNSVFQDNSQLTVSGRSRTSMHVI